ncbi:AMP-binding protein, partial [Salmonella enterica subsp. enterica serovar Istanbul]|nr:AMP-binding protein [Salmonella enterica subsp. enterica serovar Istanbul]
RSNQAAQLFRTCGLRRGDHIVILMENNRHFLEVCFGADRAGLYYTAINTHLLAHEAEYIARDCGAKLVVISQKYKDTAHGLRTNVDAISHWYSVGGDIEGYDDWDSSAGRQPTTRISD